MRWECQERVPIPTCITARAWRTCRDVCRDRYLTVSFEVGGGENVPGIPGATWRNFTYLIGDPCESNASLSWWLSRKPTSWSAVIYSLALQPIWILDINIRYLISKSRAVTWTSKENLFYSLPRFMMSLRDQLLFIVPFYGNFGQSQVDTNGTIISYQG